MLAESALGSGHTFIVDLTRHEGDSQSLIDSVDRHIKSKYPAAKVTWFARPDQVRFLENDADVVESNRFESTVVADVKRLILTMSRDVAEGTVFHVLTYDRWVLEAAASLNASSLFVVPTHMNNVKDDFDGTRHAAPRPIFEAPSSEGLSVESAILLTKRILRSGGHTSPRTALTLAKLRPKMVLLDRRARKNPLNLNSVQLINRVVAEGEKQGWLRQSRDYGPGTEFIWFSEPQDAVPIQSEDYAPEIHESPDEKSVPPLPEQALSSTPGDGRSQLELVTQREPVEDLSSNAIPSLDSQKKQRKTELMESKLRERGIGSPALVRRYLFDAVEEIVNLGSISTAQLITKTKDLAQQKYKDEGNTQTQNWTAIANCFFRMLLSADVLLREDGSTIRLGVGGYSSMVSKLVPNFRDLCEMVLLETIIKKMPHLNHSDLYELGLSIYHGGKDRGMPREAIVERTDFLLDSLQKGNRIAVDQDGEFTVADGAREALP